MEETAGQGQEGFASVCLWVTGQIRAVVSVDVDEAALHSGLVAPSVLDRFQGAAGPVNGNDAWGCKSADQRFVCGRVFTCCPLPQATTLLFWFAAIRRVHR